MFPEAKPIRLNSEMVRAIPEGNRIQTRRIIKPQPKEQLLYIGFGYGAGKWESKSEKLWTPPYTAGDILYVQEAWRPTGITSKPFAYRADEKESISAIWKPSVNMPKEAARIFLEVECVSVEHLQNTTEEFSGSISQKLWDSTIKPQKRNVYGWNANPWVWVIELAQIEH